MMSSVDGDGAMGESFHNSFVGFPSKNPLRSIRVPKKDSAALATGQDSNENSLAAKPQNERAEERKPMWFDRQVRANWLDLKFTSSP